MKLRSDISGDTRALAMSYSRCQESKLGERRQRRRRLGSIGLTVDSARADHTKCDAETRFVELHNEKTTMGDNDDVDITTTTEEIVVQGFRIGQNGPVPCTRVTPEPFHVSPLVAAPATHRS